MTDRKQFQTLMEARFHEWSKKFDALVATAKRHVAQGQISLQQHVSSLEHRRETLRNKIERLSASAGDDWQRAKRELEDAWHAFEAGTKTVQNRLTEKSHAESN